MASSDFPARSARAILAVVIGASLLGFSGCATRGAGDAKSTTLPNAITPFSVSAVGARNPIGWQPWIVSRFNRLTDYELVEFNGERVLRARSEKGASGLLQDVRIDPTKSPYLQWRWFVTSVIPGANLRLRGSDDAPVRVVVSFGGDIEKLDIEERAMASMVKLVAGRDMPYASLMYTWDNDLPADTMLDNAYSSRVRMIIVESGAMNVGKWRSFRRNVAEDYYRAFGEKPGPIISVGVMTDSNSTATDAVAYYGDLRLDAKVQ